MTNPRIFGPNDDPKLFPPRDPSATLAEDLGAVVDDARAIASELGLRPYRIFSVRVVWSGGEVGRGTPSSEEREFVPTPKIAEPSVTGEPRTGGLVERGSARLTQVSPRYTEDEVRGLCGCDATPGVEVFVEARIDARDGSTERRRFVVRGMPFRDAERFEWRVNLIRQDSDRDREGRTRTATGFVR